MSIFSWADSSIQKLEWFDLGLLKLCCVVLGVLLAVLIPSLTRLNAWLLVVVAFLLAINPVMKVFIR